MNKRIGILFLVLLALAVLSNIVLADEPANFVDTSWVLYGKAKVSASKIGRISIDGIVNVDFWPDGTIALEDEEGYTIYGDYDFDSKGKLVIDVTEQDIEDFFYTYLPDMLYGLGSFDWSIDVPSSKAKTKTKYTGNAVNLSIRLKFSAFLYINYQGRDYKFRLTYTMKIAGDHPVSGAPSWGSKWIIDGKIKVGAKKLKASELLTLKLILGDYAGSGLGLNEYELYNITGGKNDLLIEGPFCRIRNKVIFWGDEYDMFDLIEDFLEQPVQDSPDIDWLSVYYTDTKATAKVKDGQKIKLSCRSRFWADVYVKDGYADWRGSFALKGKGMPAP